MATFLDIDTIEQRNLLHSKIRTHPEVSRVVDRVERDILNYYKYRTGLNTYDIALEGYDDTTPSASNAELIVALRDAVADVASYRLLNYSKNPNFQSERLEQYTYDRGTSAGEGNYDWPSGWNRVLNRFFSERAPWYAV